MNGSADERMNGRKDEQTEFLPILQDFVPYRDRCPKKQKSIEIYVFSLLPLNQGEVEEEEEEEVVVVELSNDHWEAKKIF